MVPVNVAIWASGTGTNAENIIKTFSSNERIKVKLVIASNVEAGVIPRAITHRIPYVVISKAQMNDPKYMLPLLANYDINLHVLAEFLWKIPAYLLTNSSIHWINIHPALLPKYGGKGMYGDRVHQAVIDNKESESGITIHFVNEKYDQGDIIFQESVNVNKDDTAQLLSKKIHTLEYRYYPQIIEKVVTEYYHK